MKKFTEKDIPKEVWEHIIMVNTSKGLMGSEWYNKCLAIEDKYPDWFPWEAKYKSIPDEVHDAYRREKNPDFFLSFVEYQKKHGSSNKGILHAIRESHERSVERAIQINKEPFKESSIADLFKKLIEDKKENLRLQDEKDKKDKALWDKHYKKYGLEHRK